MTGFVVALSLALLIAMAYSRWTPGACCGCAACTILTDFDSSDWTGGGWTFSTSTADGSGYGETSATASDTTAAATCTLDAIDVGETVRLCIQATDTDNYLAGEVARTSGGYNLKLYTRSSGSDTLLASGSALSSPVGQELHVCYDGADLYARCGTTSAVSKRATTSALSGRKAAIWADSSVTLGSFVFREAEGACPTCVGPDCSKCTDDAPATMVLVLSGTANGSCSDCADLDGTYILPGPVNGTAPDSCMWSLTGLSGSCSHSRVDYMIYRTNDGLGGVNFTRQATFYITGVFEPYFASTLPNQAAGYTVDCMNWTDSPAWVSNGSSACDMSGATVDVSSP